jgi:hypothetical protein
VQGEHADLPGGRRGSDLIGYAMGSGTTSPSLLPPLEKGRVAPNASLLHSRKTYSSARHTTHTNTQHKN